MEIIKTRLEIKVNGLEDLARIATTTLSEITHYTTVSVGPDMNNHTIIDIKFVLLRKSCFNGCHFDRFWDYSRIYHQIR